MILLSVKIVMIFSQQCEMVWTYPCLKESDFFKFSRQLLNIEKVVYQFISSE